MKILLLENSITDSSLIYLVTSKKVFIGATMLHTEISFATSGRQSSQGLDVFT